MRLLVHRVTFVLAWASATALICAVIRAGKGASVAEGYMSGFFGWGIIFAIISRSTRPPRGAGNPEPTPGGESSEL